jgi:hypothetical protein
VSPKHVDPSLGYGFDYDVANSEVILTRMDVREGKLVLPGGLRYEILVLPEQDDMNVEVLRKLEQMVSAGATIVGQKPGRSNGLKGYARRDEEVRALGEKLWGLCNGEEVTEHRYGSGRIVWGRRLRDVLAERGVVPDFSFVGGTGEAEIDFIHRRLEGIDIYFVGNRSEIRRELDCTFRVRGRIPELWRPDSGAIEKPGLYDLTDGGTRLPLLLEPHGAVFVVFAESDSEDHFVRASRNGTELFPIAEEGDGGRGVFVVRQRDEGGFTVVTDREGTYVLERATGGEVELKVGAVAAPLEISGPWEVRFAEGWGAPEFKVFEELISWSQSDDEGVRFFSGVAAYQKTFTVPAEMTKPGARLFLDLGKVKEVAEIYLSGQGVGIVWKEPFRVEITGAVKAEDNKLVVEVANTWNNRLVGDGRVPQEERFTNTNIVNGPTAWLKPWKDVPLLESGLMGPVMVYSLREVVLSPGQ